IDAGCKALSVAVDNETAVDNLTRLGSTSGYRVAVEIVEGGFLVSLAKTDASELAASQQTPEQSYAVFIGKDHVGEGDPELGATLMKMALYTLAESDNPPSALLFMNSGVKLVAGDTGQIIESIAALITAGTRVLVCGACLDFYGLKESLAVGEVSNMHAILETMKNAPKVITL
ncbi:MAG: sulfurtransferase-like selenium metabolism protein YedF, partial [Raoultibacter sp.]